MLHLHPTSRVAIIGDDEPSKCVADLLAEASGLSIYSTDNYLGEGHEAALLAIMNLAGDDGWIVRGEIAPYMIKGCRHLNTEPPDFVIDLTNNKELEGEYCRLDNSLPTIWLSVSSDSADRLINGGPFGTSDKNPGR